MRAAALRSKGREEKVDLDRALAAHLCRCTGWQTIYDSLGRSRHVSGPIRASNVPRTLGGERAELETGVAQQVGPSVPTGEAGFADDLAPRDALVAVPCPPGSTATTVEAAGLSWVIGESLIDARNQAGKVQGRRTTMPSSAPIPLLRLPEGGVRIATGWVEPGYLEPDASWCMPGGTPASPLANGGAFGGKTESLAPLAARELADRYGRTVRVLYSREDVVRLGPKRPPISASAVLSGTTVEIRGTSAGDMPVPPSAYALTLDAEWDRVSLRGPPISASLRAVGLAEHSLLVEGALNAGNADRSALVVPGVADVLLDTAVVNQHGARAGARAGIDPATGSITRIFVRVAAGDPLDEVVMRSYAIGAAHMALGWVLTESIAVDIESGEVHDLTIRSLGIIRPARVPPIEVEIVDDPGEPLARSSDAVFAAVAAAVWNSLTIAEGARPETLPARETRAAYTLRA